jgi:hypothetical protein
VGARARQLAETVVYPSPLQVTCDSPKNYRGQAGVEFVRRIPTVWDDSVTLSGEVGKPIVMARRSGERWYLAAMNGEDTAKLPARLSFLELAQFRRQSGLVRLSGHCRIHARSGRGFRSVALASPGRRFCRDHQQE